MTLDSLFDSSTDTFSTASWELSSDTNSSAPGKKPKTRTLAPNLTRRSHKKSRGGCFSCKGRKIKCGEQKPACSSCLMKGISCVYPAEQQPARKNNLPLLRRNPSVSPAFGGGGGGGDGESAFSILDMRFFHHFLTIAYPHLPVDNDHVWVNEIPQFAERHSYLMHAILSLGASHLSRLTGQDYRHQSLTHRGAAIAGLNAALSKTARSYGESDAMLASCYALTFQASYMGDGLSDFITMVRGCALTTEKVLTDHSPTAFNLQPGWHFKYMQPRLAALPVVDPILLADAYAALDEVGPYVTGNTELDFHDALVGVVASLQESPAAGYLQFTGVYGVWIELGHDEFRGFLDPANHVAQLLLAYFIGIQLLMVPLATYEWAHRSDVTRVRTLYGTIEWAQGIFTRLAETQYAPLLRWPKSIVATVIAEINGDVLHLPSVLQLHLSHADIMPQALLTGPP